MIEILSYPFMQRALIAALLTGLIAPAIGTYVVQRRLSLLGDGLGHVALAGVGLALLTGTAPIPLAVAACVAGAVIVEVLRQRGKATGDVGLAVLFYGASQQVCSCPAYPASERVGWRSTCLAHSPP